MTRETVGGWIEEIPAVDIELMENGSVRVTDRSCLDQDYSVDLHPIHLRLIAEKLGLVREVSASDAELIRTLRGQVADSARTVKTLVRRMRVLQERTAFIQSWLCTHSDSQHADLSYEMDYTTGSMVICDEFCEELDDMLERAGNAGTVTKVTSQPPSANAPSVTGALAEPAGINVETQLVSGKACANPSGNASAKASVKASQPGTGSLFGGDHG